jgi:hypothetical protein
LKGIKNYRQAARRKVNKGFLLIVYSQGGKMKRTKAPRMTQQILAPDFDNIVKSASQAAIRRRANRHKTVAEQIKKIEHQRGHEMLIKLRTALEKGNNGILASEEPTGGKIAVQQALKQFPKINPISDHWKIEFLRLQEKKVRQGLLPQTFDFDGIEPEIQSIAMNKVALLRKRKSTLALISIASKTRTAHKVYSEKGFSNYERGVQRRLDVLNALLLMHNEAPIDRFGRRKKI